MCVLKMKNPCQLTLGTKLYQVNARSVLKVYMLLFDHGAEVFFLFLQIDHAEALTRVLCQFEIFAHVFIRCPDGKYQFFLVFIFGPGLCDEDKLAHFDPM